MAPQIQKRAGTITTPWLNATTHSVRKSCRKAEQKWKKEKLQVFSEMFRDFLKTYRNTAKSAKVEYYAQLINNNAQRPKVLFNNIYSILNPASASTTLAPSTETCEKFLNFFINKIDQIKPNKISVIEPALSRFQQFQAISPPQLAKLVSLMKSTSCHLDVLPAHLFK